MSVDNNIKKPINNNSSYVSLADMLPKTSRVGDNSISQQGSNVASPPTKNWRHCGGSQYGIEVQREAILHNMQEILQHLHMLRRKNWSPDMPEAVFDAALLPTMIKAEKAHNPENTVVLIDNDNSLGETRQAILQVPGMYHYIAADVRTVDGQQSVILLDSLPRGNVHEYAELLGALHSQFNRADKVSLIYTGLQSSFFDCQAFALSTSTKMAKSADYLDSLHETQVRQGHKALGELTATRLMKKQGSLNVFSATNTLPASFVKHAQSLSVLTQRNLDKPVNKLGQSLSQRNNEKMVERTQIRTSDNKPKLQWLKFSASIEDKRMTYLERAISYMKTAPAEDVTELASRFDFVAQSEILSPIFAKQMDTRLVGPADQVSLRLIPTPGRSDPAEPNQNDILSQLQARVGRLQMEIP